MNIGITMIGASGAGKTCYLYAMASQMAFGCNSFTFAPTDYDKGLELDEGWDDICNGKWPAGSIESSDFEFSCSHSFKEIMRFNWHDYRGGILNGHGEDDKAEREILFAKIRESATLIICVSADMLLGVQRGDSSAAMTFRNYMRILNMYNQQTGKTIPVVFAITKADMLENAAGSIKEGVEYLKTSYFAKFFEPNEDANLRWLIMFVPVSLGQNLGCVGGRVTGHIAPCNVHIPVLFAIRNALVVALAKCQGACSSAEDNVRASQGRLKSEKDKPWLIRIFGDKTSELSRRLDQSQGELAALRAQERTISQDIENITKEFIDGQALVYLNGEKVI